MLYIVDHFDITNVDSPLSVRFTDVKSDELFEVVDKQIIESRVSNFEVLNFINNHVKNKIDKCVYAYGLSLGDVALMCELIDDNTSVIHKIETFLG